MIAVDWTMVLLGGAVGAVVGAFFFVGLAIGMRRALRSENSVALLMLSSVVRILTLLGIGWIVLGQGGPWAGAGFAVAFLISRRIATTIARVGIPEGGTS
jgi:hypothetical protein